MTFHPGGEGLAQDRDQRLQGRKWQHIQPGRGGGLHVRRPNRPQDLPVDRGRFSRCNVLKGISLVFVFNFFAHIFFVMRSHCSRISGLVESLQFFFLFVLFFDFCHSGLQAAEKFETMNGEDVKHSTADLNVKPNFNHCKLNSHSTLVTLRKAGISKCILLLTHTPYLSCAPPALNSFCVWC